MGKRPYEKPEIKDVGSLEELTQQQFNKVGPSPDVVTSANPNIVGSLTPIQ